jgi:hypothetical protein
MDGPQGVEETVAEKPHGRSQGKAQQIIDHLKQYPNDPYTQVADLFEVSDGYVSILAGEIGLPKRRVRRKTGANEVQMPQIETAVQIAAELEERKRRMTEEKQRIAELEEKLASSVFHYDADRETGMVTIRQGTQEVKAHYSFFFAFFNNGEPAKARAFMTEAFCRRQAA